MKADPEKIAERGWDLIDQATRTGSMTLPSGKIVTLDTEHLVRLVQWAATQRVKKPKILETPDDIELKPTGGR